MSGVWHASELTPAELDICLSILDTCAFLSEDAVAHLGLALVCGTVQRAGLVQREYVLEEWRVQIECSHG